MDCGRERESFWQFSDQLRLQAAGGLSGISIPGDSIWSDPFLTSKNPEERTLDLNVAGWKMGSASQKLAFGNISAGRYDNNNNTSSSSSSGGNVKVKTKNYNNNDDDNKNSNGEIKNYYNKAIDMPVSNIPGSNKKCDHNNDGKSGGAKKNSCGGKGNSSSGNGAVEKRFKTLPASESLPRSEAVGGYVFVCNNDTMQENLRRQLFGLPPRYRDSVRAITPGLPLFLYNYSTHQLHGVFEAASFGGTNIDPTAWEDKKSLGESRFPAQVRVVTRKLCEPLDEDSFRPILHHYDGPKFRLELTVPEALALLDALADNNS